MEENEKTLMHCHHTSLPLKKQTEFIYNEKMEKKFGAVCNLNGEDDSE